MKNVTVVEKTIIDPLHFAAKSNMHEKCVNCVYLTFLWTRVPQRAEIANRTRCAHRLLIPMDDERRMRRQCTVQSI